MSEADKVADAAGLAALESMGKYISTICAQIDESASGGDKAVFNHLISVCVKYAEFNNLLAARGLTKPIVTNR